MVPGVAGTLNRRGGCRCERAGDGYVFLMVRQAGGLARLYYFPGEKRRREFSRRQGADRLLQACRHVEYPRADEVAQATPTGPCATYPGDHTWTDTRDGVVLTGDAAGPPASQRESHPNGGTIRRELRYAGSAACSVGG